MTNKTGLDNFSFEYKELLKEVARLKEEQQQQTQFIENLMSWLLKASIQNFDKQNSIELLELILDFLNNSKLLGSESFTEALKNINQNLLNDSEVDSTSNELNVSNLDC